MLKAIAVLIAVAAMLIPVASCSPVVAAPAKPVINYHLDKIHYGGINR